MDMKTDGFIKIKLSVDKNVIYDISKHRNKTPFSFSSRAGIMLLVQCQMARPHQALMLRRTEKRRFANFRTHVALAKKPCVSNSVAFLVASYLQIGFFSTITTLSIRHLCKRRHFFVLRSHRLPVDRRISLVHSHVPTRAIGQIRPRPHWTATAAAPVVAALVAVAAVVAVLGVVARVRARRQQPSAQANAPMNAIANGRNKRVPAVRTTVVGTLHHPSTTTIKRHQSQFTYLCRHLLCVQLRQHRLVHIAAAQRIPVTTSRTSPAQITTT